MLAMRMIRRNPRKRELLPLKWLRGELETRTSRTDLPALLWQLHLREQVPRKQTN